MGERLGPYLKLARRIVLIDVAIFVVAGVVSWLIGWRTMYAYCDAVVPTGMIVIAVGLSFFLGTWSANQGFLLMHAQSMTDMDGHGRVRLLRRDDDEAYRMFILVFVAGVVAAVVAAVIQAVVESPASPGPVA